MDFLQIEIKCHNTYSEIIIAELATIGYDSFWEKEDGLAAYIERQSFDETLLTEIFLRYASAAITYQVAELENKNWNEDWEKSFEPITIADKCYIRATFHEPRPNFPLEIIIDPKMSFGTGHHATTAMMIEHLLSLDIQHKKIMDVGCGSAILSIAAEKLGAGYVLAFDNDEWAVANSLENVVLNECQHIEILKGTILAINPDGVYDVILANITRNILLQEIKVYAACLAPEGILVISGFYEQDAESLVREATMAGLQKANQLIKDNGWASLSFVK